MKETVHDFSQVDQVTDAQYYIQFLEEISRLESVRDCKRLMLQSLGIQGGQRLLDVGCGLGDDAREMAHLVGDSGRVVGLDSSQAMIAEAQKRSESGGLAVEFIVGDAEKLDFPSESFDACRSERTLIHLNAGQALDEIIRVTKPGGSLVVFDLDAEGISFDNSRPALTRKILQFHSDSYRNGIVVRQLARLFKERKLTDVTFRPHSVICPFPFFKRIYTGVLIKAQEAEVITATESVEWFNEAVEADLRGCSFSWYQVLLSAAESRREPWEKRKDVSNFFSLLISNSKEGQMTVEQNKAMGTRFFEELLDNENFGVLNDLFTEDCLFHRGDLTEPARGIAGIRSIVENRIQLYRDFRTTIHQIIGEGNLVATRETHKGIHRGQFPTPIGTFDVTGRPIEWTSQVVFRFEHGKIAEMWVARDELGILRYLGIVLEARQ